jgi:hypothetical protein
MTSMLRTPVRILEQTVEKVVTGDVQALADKYRDLRQIGQKAGFVVPAVQHVRGDGNTLVFERIHHMRSIRDWYLESMGDPSLLEITAGLFHRVGAILAAIHAGEYSHEGETWSPPVRFSSAVAEYMEGAVGEEGDAVELHGDFGFANVFTCGQEPSGCHRLVVIDPCADGYSTFNDWCRGPRYVDLGKMLLSLEGKVSLRHQGRLRPTVIRALQQSFIRGYGDHAGVPVDPAMSYAYAYGAGACYFRYRFGPLGRYANRMIFNRGWKRSFPLVTKLEWMSRV